MLSSGCGSPLANASRIVVPRDVAAMTGPPAEARPQQCCYAMQVQAENERNSQQLNLAKKHIQIMSPGNKQTPRAFRNEYERVMEENVALKATAEGSQEVQHLVEALMCALATAMQCEATRSLLLCNLPAGHIHGTALIGAVGCSSVLVDQVDHHEGCGIHS